MLCQLCNTLRLKLLVFLFLLPQVLSAHELSPTVINLYLTDQPTAELHIDLNLESVVAGVGADHEDTDDSPNAEVYNRLRALPIDQMHTEAAASVNTLLSRLGFSNADGQAVDLELNLAGLTTEPVEDLDLPRDTQIQTRLKVEQLPFSLQFRMPEQYGETIFRVHQGDQIIAALFLQPGEQSEFITLAGGEEQQAQGFWQYIVIGFEHILPLGLDHILFVIGIYLLSQRLSDLLWQVSAFTVAHTITLALATLGWVSLSGSIVEPLIALSIAYVAIENLFRHRINRGRIALVFGFGLLHGLGFAGVLSEIGLDPNAFIASLIAFNIGVELGQLAVILGMYLLLGRWLGNTDKWDPYVRRPISVFIALIGLYWFVERAFL